MKNEGKWHCLAEQCVKKFSNKAKHLKDKHKSDLSPPKAVLCKGQGCEHCVQKPSKSLRT